MGEDDIVERISEESIIEPNLASGNNFFLWRQLLKNVILEHLLRLCYDNDYSVEKEHRCSE